MTATTKQLLIALILLSVAGCGASVELSQTEQDAIDVLGALGGTFHDEENPGNRIGKRSRPEEERFGFTMLNCLANEL
ncbi:MAG: hypothetical protein ABGZ35_19050 [Planctomycetaceae bacterium]